MGKFKDGDLVVCVSPCKGWLLSSGKERSYLATFGIGCKYSCYNSKEHDWLDFINVHSDHFELVEESSDEEGEDLMVKGEDLKSSGEL